MHHLPHHPTPTCVALLWLWQLCVAFRNSTNMCDYHWHFFYHTLISLLDFVSANRFKGLQRWKLRIVMFNPKTFVFFFGAETCTNIYIDWMSSSPKNSSSSFGFCLQLCVCVITCCKKMTLASDSVEMLFMIQGPPLPLRQQLCCLATHSPELIPLKWSLWRLPFRGLGSGRGGHDNVRS